LASASSITIGAGSVPSAQVTGMLVRAQGVHRDTQLAGPRVVQGDLDGGLGVKVRRHHVGDIAHDRVDVVDAAADQHRGEVALDDDPHRLDRLAAPPGSAGHHTFPHTAEPTLGADEDVEHGLGVHGGPGEPVRAAQRDVHQHRVDPLDPHVGHDDSPFACGVGRT
jgi:hypothetical protein